MLARRTLLASVGLAGLAVGLGGRRAAASWAAGSSEIKMSPVAGMAEHRTLIVDAQAALRRDIAAGLARPDARRPVVCPLCRCPMTVGADSAC